MASAGKSGTKMQAKDMGEDSSQLPVVSRKPSAICREARLSAVPLGALNLVIPTRERSEAGGICFFRNSSAVLKNSISAAL